jgi:hypothetical protein
MKNLLSVLEAAQSLGCSFQNIYSMIKRKRIIATIVDKKIFIESSQLQHYLNNRYNRKFSYYQGEFIFDSSQGRYSVKQLAGLLGVKPYKIYADIRAGLIPFQIARKGTYVIHIKDIVQFIQSFKNKKP